MDVYIFKSIQIQPSGNKNPSIYNYQETKTVQNKQNIRQMDVNIFSSTYPRLNPETQKFWRMFFSEYYPNIFIFSFLYV